MYYLCNASKLFIGICVIEKNSSEIKKKNVGDLPHDFFSKKANITFYPFFTIFLECFPRFFQKTIFPQLAIFPKNSHKLHNVYQSRHSGRLVRDSSRSRVGSILPQNTPAQNCLSGTISTSIMQPLIKIFMMFTSKWGKSGKSNIFIEL